MAPAVELAQTHAADLRRSAETYRVRREARRILRGR